MKELGPCIICRQKLATPANRVWKIHSGQKQSMRMESEHGGESELFHIDCSRCKSSSFVMIVPGPFHAKAIIQVLTDLTKEDLPKIQRLEGIDANEVLEFHAFFNR